MRAKGILWIHSSFHLLPEEPQGECYTETLIFFTNKEQWTLGCYSPDFGFETEMDLKDVGIS
jgi:hypothetical protein